MRSHRIHVVGPKSTADDAGRGLEASEKSNGAGRDKGHGSYRNAAQRRTMSDHRGTATGAANGSATAMVQQC